MTKFRMFTLIGLLAFGCVLMTGCNSCCEPNPCDPCAPNPCDEPNPCDPCATGAPAATAPAAAPAAAPAGSCGGSGKG